VRFRRRVLRDEEEEEEEEEESFLVFTDKSPTLRAPLDEARMMSSSKGCQVGTRDAFARKAMEDLNLLWSSSNNNNNNNNNTGNNNNNNNNNNSDDNAQVCFHLGHHGSTKRRENDERKHRRVREGKSEE
jgi:hypothetical protein